MIMMPTSTTEEHEQFLHAMKMFPTGPWRSIAAFIGTRSIKQVQTHAQKYQQKINRRRRGLRKQKKKFRVKNFTVQGSPRSPSAFPIGAMSPLSCGFGELLTGGCSPVASDADSSISSSSSTSLAILDMDIDMDPLLCDLEPLPYTSEVSFEQVLADDAYRQDVQESIDLLLA
ncbi:Myb domain [Phytophthora cactorum]|nr:Myb domain [Phytophthora cactorum]